MTSVVDNAGVTHAVNVGPDPTRTGRYSTVSRMCTPRWFMVSNEEIRRDQAVDCMTCLVRKP
jgi:hypothetical protein